MSKKSELLEKAQELKLDVTEKNTIAEIEAALSAANAKNPSQKERKIAKAGKHSAKGIKESSEKQAKIEKQKQRNEQEEASTKDTKKPKKIIKPTRSILERKGKKYQAAAKLIDKTKEYNVSEALSLAIKTNPTKFNATVELHIKLGVDPRQADQNIRGTVDLPSGSGKTIRVAVFADEELAKKAKAAGADISESDEFLQRLDKEQLDFDVLIATPQMMAKLGKYARLLGPKGLMPNPKSGTVTKEISTAVKSAKAGRVEYRVDSSGIVHLGIGKTDFTPEDLLSNTQAVIDAIKNAKPANLKTAYINSAFITTSMGPSIRLSINEL